MTAKVDASECSTVVWCPKCAWYSEATRTESGGHDLAVKHDTREHPENNGAIMNRFNFRKKSLPLTA